MPGRDTGLTRWLGVAAVVTLAAAFVVATRSRLPQPPDAVAQVQGGPLAPAISGRVTFRDVPGGTLVQVELGGLPPYRPGTPPVGPHGFHIHEVGSCEVGDPRDPFLAAGGHFNPGSDLHGNHAGDFPVLFSNGGRASMAFLSSRFRAADVVGRSVIVHENPDDFRTQPAGASGRRLACGVIERAR